ncbi:MAG TPA: aspartyl protease family protein [Candidatus Eisenbacteria bacterium]|nr:aspartyl protease family protein [Candidatus Eisenbacteria bacterium]
MPKLIRPLYVACLASCLLASDAESQPLVIQTGADAGSIVIHLGPDESSPPAGFLKRGESATPIAESIGPQGLRWYLIESRRGVIGWVKKADADTIADVEKAFRPVPPPTVTELAMAHSASVAAESENAIRIPVKMNGTSVIVPVTLNRRIKALLALDTGATTTMISRRIAKDLGLRTDGPRIVAMTVSGPMSMPMARVGSLKVGEAEVHNLTVTVHDLMPTARVDGLLGLDFLSRFHLSIDSKNQIITLAPR